MPESDILVACRSAVIYHQGRQLGIRRGVTTIRAGHPLLDTHADLFEPLTVTLDHLRAIAPASQPEPEAPKESSAPAAKQSRRSR